MKNKKIFLFIILLFLSISIKVNSQNKLNTIEKGKEIFEIFKSINLISDETYLQKFIDLDFLRNTIRKNKNLDEIKKNEILHKPKEIWNDKIIKELNEIKALGEKYKIKWSEIQYSDFTYNINEKNKFGLKKYNCMLVFKTNELKNRIYGIEVDFLEINNTLYIIEIDDLNILTKNN